MCRNQRKRADIVSEKHNSTHATNSKPSVKASSKENYAKKTRFSTKDWCVCKIWRHFHRQNRALVVIYYRQTPQPRWSIQIQCFFDWPPSATQYSTPKLSIANTALTLDDTNIMKTSVNQQTTIYFCNYKTVNCRKFICALQSTNPVPLNHRKAKYWSEVCKVFRQSASWSPWGKPR